MRSRPKKTVLLAAIIVAPFILGYAWWQHHYPYGMSHCCDLCLSGALGDYAIIHGGAFPAGEATPAASLSLLYREKIDGRPLAGANLLRGKTVPESVVKEILERGELLTPDTCGWHYVEGLRADDDPRLALFWDKAGLDHNGGRMAEGGHIVLFVPLMDRKHIPEAEWEEFLAEQSKLLAERSDRNPLRCHDSGRIPRSQSTGSCRGRLHLWFDVGFARDDCNHQETGVGDSRASRHPN